MTRCDRPARVHRAPGHPAPAWVPILPATPSTITSPFARRIALDRRVGGFAQQLFEMRDIANCGRHLHRRPIMTPMSLPDGVSIRDMTPDDIAAGLALCRASSWNQTEQDWRFFLTAAPHGALVA